MIIDERMVTYINSLDTGHTPFLENLERTAKQDRVPIIRREMQSFLKVFLKMKQPKRILEVGTAVGFSAVFMAQYGEPDAEITFQFSGSDELLDVLDITNAVSVDLSGYTQPGTYDVPVDVNVPKGITLVNNVTVNLVLEEKQNETVSGAENSSG